MAPDPGFFEAFYASPLQHPILLWLAAGIATAFCLLRPGLSPSLRRYCAALGALSLLDAWLTSPEIFGLGRLSGWLASSLPLLFVLAGDYRYLLLVLAATPDGRIEPTSRRLLAAAALTLIVPIASQQAHALLPEASSNPRTLFLIYEVAFVLLTGALLRFHPSARSVPWIRSVSYFVMLYYAVWASADLVILATGSDFGFGLRVVPNVLYYGGLVAAIGWLAPGSATPRP